ncbi:hypothetical protein D3C75_851120 [compost metagenome]
MSLWNQWFMPAPTMIIERPWVLSAVRANSRAISITSPRGTPVMRSCQAGVPGTFSSKLLATLAPPKPRSTPYCASSRS